MAEVVQLRAMFPADGIAGVPRRPRTGGLPAPRSLTPYPTDRLRMLQVPALLQVLAFYGSLFALANVSPLSCVAGVRKRGGDCWNEVVKRAKLVRPGVIYLLCCLTHAGCWGCRTEPVLFPGAGTKRESWTHTAKAAASAGAWTCKAFPYRDQVLKKLWWPGSRLCCCPRPAYSGSSISSPEKCPSWRLSCCGSGCCSLLIELLRLV